MSTSKLETIVIEPTQPAQHTVIWLHGLGADGHDFVDIIPALNLPAKSAVRFIFPHAPVIPVTLNGGMRMRAWFDIHGLTLDAKLDEPGINATNQAIINLIAQEQQQGIAANKIVLAGFSQGGAIALYSGLTYPKPLAGIIGLSTFLPAQFFQDNVTLAIQRDTPIFMAHGEFDPIVDFAWGRTAKERLVQLGCQLTWHTYPMPHSVCPEEIEAIGEWLKKVLI